jgi:hypothetical protein
MATAAQRIADLEQQLAELTARVEQLHQEAFIIRTLDEIALERAGLGYDGAEASAMRAAFIAGKASAREGTTPRPPARRPHHLSVIGGGAS